MANETYRLYIYASPQDCGRLRKRTWKKTKEFTIQKMIDTEVGLAFLTTYKLGCLEIAENCLTKSGKT